MTFKAFSLLSIALGVASWALLQLVPNMSAANRGVWLPVGVGVVVLTTMLSRWWVGKAKSGTPMSFVAAVNGSTAVKMFALLILITSYLMTENEGRVEFALGMFAVFVLQVVLFVWEVTTLVKKDKKNS